MAFTSVAYPTGLPDQTARAAVSLGAVGFAYMDALARSDWAGATGLLTLFQELFNEHRVATLIGFAAGDRLEASRQIPQSLAIDGMFGANSRTALVAALVSGVGLTPAVADTMPREAGALGRWFTLKVSPRISQTPSAGSESAYIRSIADVAARADMAQASYDVRAAVLPFILGGGSATSGPDCP